MRHKAYRVAVLILASPYKQQRSVNIDTLAYPVDIRVLLFKQVVKFIDLGVVAVSYTHLSIPNPKPLPLGKGLFCWGYRP